MRTFFNLVALACGVCVGGLGCAEVARATTYHRQKVTCCVCGGTSEQTVVMSTYTPSWSRCPPELDLRPTCQLREVMQFFTAECPHCGYVSEDLSAATSLTPEVWNLDRYPELKRGSPLAQKLVKYALISEQNGDPERIVAAWLQAAWMFDDGPAPANARFCREKSLEAFGNIPARELSHELVLIRADLLRRTGRFLECIAHSREHRNRVGGNGLFEDCLNRQVRLCLSLDTRAHEMPVFGQEAVMEYLRDPVAGAEMWIEGDLAPTPLGLMLIVGGIPWCFVGALMYVSRFASPRV